MLTNLFFIPLTNAKVYTTQDEFLSRISNEKEVQIESKTLWLNKNIQAKIIKILDHKYPKLRLRYKVIKDLKETPNFTSVWFLDEIGKERPISFGVEINNSQIINIQVLEFRESRGYEISIPAFAKQFELAQINQNGKLNKNIDGITGATMSVSAMKKISRVALMLHEHIKTSSTNKLK